MALVRTVTDDCRAARAAARELLDAPAAARDRALTAIADAVERRIDDLLETSAAEVASVPAARHASVRLTRRGLVRALAGLRSVAAAPDPLGEPVEVSGGARRIRVPLGVVGLVIDGRAQLVPPSVAVALKSGNALVVCGSADGVRTLTQMCNVIAGALSGCGLPGAAVTCLEHGGEEAIRALAAQAGLVDLIKQRGRDATASAILRGGSVPAILAIDGNCHVYVDESASEETALSVILASKLTAPGMCNAAETVLVHRSVAPRLLARVGPELHARGVELRLSDRAQAALGELPPWGVRATADDWATEYLAPVLAVGVVDSLEDAIAHIDRYGSGHTEAIVTATAAAAERFQRLVDAAYVCVNAPTARSGGAALGRVAELGNSTQRLPARGPIGAPELCTTKTVIGELP